MNSGNFFAILWSYIILRFLFWAELGFHQLPGSHHPLYYWQESLFLLFVSLLWILADEYTTIDLLKVAMAVVTVLGGLFMILDTYEYYHALVTVHPFIHESFKIILWIDIACDSVLVVIAAGLGLSHFNFARNRSIDAELKRLRENR